MPENLSVAQIELQSVADRVRQVLVATSLSQAELARKLGLSDGFMSQVVRGLKRPGTEFFTSLNRELGVSIDWLLAGRGSMFCLAISEQLLSTIRIQVATARAAYVDNDPDAKELLAFMASGRAATELDQKRFNALLDRIAPEDPDTRLAVQLYNAHQWAPDPKTQRDDLLASAIGLFEDAKVRNRFSLLLGEGRPVAPRGELPRHLG
jgi:transcriptional regulator with XRE-family HTH domain